MIAIPSREGQNLAIRVNQVGPDPLAQWENNGCGSPVGGPKSRVPRKMGIGPPRNPLCGGTRRTGTELIMETGCSNGPEETEVEVTPEMIEVGAAVLTVDAAQDVVDGYANRWALAEEVCRAMLLARCATPRGRREPSISRP